MSTLNRKASVNPLHSQDGQRPMLPTLTQLISNFIRSSLLLLLSSQSFVLSLLNSQTQKKTNLQKELWRLKANAASIGSKTTPTPSSSTVSSALAAPLALSPRVLPREDSYDTVLVVCWDECCPVTADSKAAKQRNERIKRNKGKIRLPQPSPIKQPAAPAEGSPLPPSILDLVSRFSLWTLITRLPPTSLVASQTSLPPTQTSSPKKRRFSIPLRRHPRHHPPLYLSLTSLVVKRADICSFEAQTMPAWTIFLVRFL
ncbi:hypothetical protein BLNAU_21708 [Blattamonas nauphoetae]|uniref:Uncharacterized protein n=1 Tax=Blattamonas nauphoetae TaxID=2049346 RepID=A0ABQ9WVP7_9EUKA|nr:hypothetical protein BLNAU_21708 [Blattamonas nauphoetae]